MKQKEWPSGRCREANQASETLALWRLPWWSSGESVIALPETTISVSGISIHVHARSKGDLEEEKEGDGVVARLV